MDGPLAAGVIAVILKGYPRLSETFIAQELHALEARGVALALFSLRHPTDREAHPIHAEIRAPVTYLPEYLHRRAGAGLARLARGRAPPRISRCARRLVARLPARPDAVADPPPGAGVRAGGRVAGRRRPAARAFPAHAGLGDAVRGHPARPAVELLGARQGHLDDARMGEARKARRLRLDDHVHRGQCPPSARPRRRRTGAST